MVITEINLMEEGALSHHFWSVEIKGSDPFSI